MAPHQERVVAERNELSGKITKLSAFFTTSSFLSVDVLEQGRLIKQCVVMEDYLGVLNERIANFGE